MPFKNFKYLNNNYILYSVQMKCKNIHVHVFRYKNL